MFNIAMNSLFGSVAFGNSCEDVAGTTLQSCHSSIRVFLVLQPSSAREVQFHMCH